MPSVRVVRVFTGEGGTHGNALGVIADGAAAAGRERRQAIAFELGFSETVFIDDVATGALQIFTPAHELPFAGHPLVGTAWLLAKVGTPVSELRPPAGPVACGADPGGAWIEADPALSPPWRLVQLDSPSAVDALDAAAMGPGVEDYCWAWIDEAAGIVRARSFAQTHGLVEDEATGSAALMLGGALGRRLTIHQGLGSRIEVAPAAAGRVRVGGGVVADDPIALPR